MTYIGDYNTSSTVRIYFTTHAQTGAPVAPSSAFEAADVKLYKNGSATERSSTSGWTMTSPFDSITGLHLLSIDLSDNTDAGFYAAAGEYAAVLSPDETVDGLAVVKVLATFSIERPIDTLFKRDWNSVTGEAARSMLNALRMLRNKWSVSGGTLTVTKENDTTTAWTASVTGDAAAVPIIGSDPA